MTVTIQPEIIKKIADALDSGMTVFYHIETGELVAYPDEMHHIYFDASEWRKEINAVKKERKKYLEFETMETRDSMRMMEHFAENIQVQKTRELFEDVLNRRKPFQGFKQLLREHPTLQREWYIFKDEQYISWVKNQLEAHNLES